MHQAAVLSASLLSPPECTRLGKGEGGAPLNGQQALQVSCVLAQGLLDVLLDAERQQLQAALAALEVARGLVQQRLQHAQLERQRPSLAHIIDHRLHQPKCVAVLPAVQEDIIGYSFNSMLRPTCLAWKSARQLPIEGPRLLDAPVVSLFYCLWCDRPARRSGKGALRGRAGPAGEDDGLVRVDDGARNLGAHEHSPVARHNGRALHGHADRLRRKQRRVARRQPQRLCCLNPLLDCTVWVHDQHLQRVCFVMRPLEPMISSLRLRFHASYRTVEQNCQGPRLGNDAEETWPCTVIWKVRVPSTHACAQDGRPRLGLGPASMVF